MRIVTLVVLVIDAFLLAWAEIAWLSYRVGTVPVPATVLLALVTTPLLVAASAALGRSGLGVLAGWTLTVLVAGVWSPAGPGLMPVDWRALVLVAAGVVPGLVVLARRPPWPSGSPQGVTSAH